MGPFGWALLGRSWVRLDILDLLTVSHISLNRFQKLFKGKFEELGLRSWIAGLSDTKALRRHAA